MASTAAAQPVLPEELLEEIFLRLDSAADLARASAACSSIRRLVSARRFLRRFRSLHTPSILGFLDCDGHEGFLPVEPAHRSAPATRALAQAADFTFSFLPDPCHMWRPRHARDGRVLLSRRIATATAFEDLMVCDPLHRRYVMIPPVPDDLAASVPQPGTIGLQPILAPAGEEDDDKESSFRVICTLQFENKFMAFVFSSGNDKWQGITYHSSRSLPDACLGYHSYYAHGCVYWIVDPLIPMGSLLVLDTRGMEFSILGLPPNNYGSVIAIMEAGEGKFGLLTFNNDTVHLFCKICQSKGVGAEEWQHDKMIPLPKHRDGFSYNWYILGTAEHYLPLLAHRAVYRESPDPGQYFVLDVKTLLLERLRIEC